MISLTIRNSSLMILNTSLNDERTIYKICGLVSVRSQIFFVDFANDSQFVLVIIVKMMYNRHSYKYVGKYMLMENYNEETDEYCTVCCND